MINPYFKDEYERFKPSLPSPGSTVLFKDKLYIVHTVKMLPPEFVEYYVTTDTSGKYIDFKDYGWTWTALIYDKKEVDSYLGTYPYGALDEFFVDRFCHRVSVSELKWGEMVDILYDKI